MLHYLSAIPVIVTVLVGAFFVYTALAPAKGFIEPRNWERAFSLLIAACLVACGGMTAACVF